MRRRGTSACCRGRWRRSASESVSQAGAGALGATALVCLLGLRQGNAAGLAHVPGADLESVPYPNAIMECTSRWQCWPASVSPSCAAADRRNRSAGSQRTGFPHCPGRGGCALVCGDGCVGAVHAPCRHRCVSGQPVRAAVEQPRGQVPDPVGRHRGGLWLWARVRTGSLADLLWPFSCSTWGRSPGCTCRRVQLSTRNLRCPERLLTCGRELSRNRDSAAAVAAAPEAVRRPTCPISGDCRRVRLLPARPATLFELTGINYIGFDDYRCLASGNRVLDVLATRTSRCPPRGWPAPARPIRRFR
jgi:hypothetical protein